MTIPRCAWCLVAALAGALGASSAGADVYVWVDARGHTNVSNIAPPEDARVTSVIKSVPRTAAQEEAARTAAQRAEMQALADRVTTLQDQLEQSRREAAWMPAAYAPPPVVYAPPPPQYSWAQPPAPELADTAPSWGWGCDSPWNSCGLGFGGWPGVAVIVNDGKRFHRGPGHGHGMRPMPTPTPRWTGPVRPLGATSRRG